MSEPIKNIRQVQDFKNKTFAATRIGITGLCPLPGPCTLVTSDGQTYEVSPATHVIAFDKDGNVWPITHKYVSENYIVHEIGVKAWHMVEQQTLEAQE